MSVIGERLRSVREGKGLSLRKFANKLGLDFTVVARIEKGQRFPPKQKGSPAKFEKLAQVLALTPEQLDALIAVERRGMNPNEVLPEIPPAHRSTEEIEAAAANTLADYSRKTGLSGAADFIDVHDVAEVGCELTVRHTDFTGKPSLGSGRRNLYGCLFPDVFERKERVVLVNSGRVDRHLLSRPEIRITVAHEVGHYVLHCPNKESMQLCFRFTKGPTFCRRAECQHDPFDLREHQATVFAACLLMPSDQFRSQWRALMGSIVELAKHFEVTESLVQFRAKVLGHVDNVSITGE